MIGFTSTTFRPYSVEEIVGFAVESGAECVEWGGDVHVTSIEDAIKVKALCEGKLAISSYGSYYRVGCCDREKWRSICAITSAMGAKSIRVWIGVSGSKRTSEDAYRKIVDDAKDMAKVASQYGLTVSGECHPNTYNDSLESGQRFLKDVDERNFKTYFQSLYRNMSRDLERLRATINDVNCVHLSFSEVGRMQFLRRKDSTCIKQITDELLKLKFGGNVLLEYVKFSNPSNFKEDMKKLKDLLSV